MKICCYVVKHDSGLAPNPFGGYCTLALCTPNHRNAQLKEGDWIVGCSPKKDGNRLVYAMRVCERLSFNDYFEDERFQAKKPVPNGTLEQQCGDNLYFRTEMGDWKRLESNFHNSLKEIKKDLGGNGSGRPVFVSKHYYYFGRGRIEIPDEFLEVIQDRQGIKYVRDKGKIEAFLYWLETTSHHSNREVPRDLSDRSKQDGAIITGISFVNGSINATHPTLPGAPNRGRKRNHC